jgi:hypothetical protein
MNATRRAALVVFATLLVVCFIPLETKQGIDDSLLVWRVPLCVKATGFYLRHLQLRQMLAEAAGGEMDPERRILKLLAWTRARVQPQPPGVPVVDDHISHIVRRRYGTDGQMAEVFTTLAFYDGHDARWVHTAPRGAGQPIVLAFVAARQGWWVFDVTNGGWFETPAGRIATMAEFQRPESLRRRGAPAELQGLPYLAYFEQLDLAWARSFSRAPGQVPWRRLLSELGFMVSDAGAG